jgi:hypothetical protein
MTTNKVKRSLLEIYKDIEEHKSKIKDLENEIKIFQSECSHPENFTKKEYTSYTDEYGRSDGSSIKIICLLCGASNYEKD